MVDAFKKRFCDLRPTDECAEELEELDGKTLEEAEEEHFED